MSKPGISLQLWSLRDDYGKDFAKTVDQVAKIGFKAVELGGFGNLNAVEGAKAIAGSGLTVSGMHVGLGSLRNNLDQVITEALLVNSTDVICPWYSKDLFVSAASVQNLGEELNTIGAKLRAFGIKLHYHNHDPELKVVEGRTIFDWLLRSSEPRNLLAQPDVYWVHVGGKNPAQFIRELGSRIELIHIKDSKELGTGPVQFPEIFEAAESIGSVRWYVIEVENYNFVPLESVRKSYELMKSWGK